MLLPFQRKTFTTSLSIDDARSAVGSIFTEQVGFSLLRSRKYHGSIEGKTFTIQKGPFLTTSIRGDIRDGQPTIVELRAVPSYIFIAFISLFSIMFVPVMFNVDEMTINGVDRVPELYERLLLASTGSLFPALIFFFGSTLQGTDLERRLKEALKLRKVDG